MDGPKQLGGERPYLRPERERSRSYRILQGAVTVMVLVAFAWLLVLGLIAATRAVL